ncbi:DUF4278 domain-containing protein [Synechococcus sp. CS-602]|uniref:DUF4278 domain-containing protein n=1 Tax=Synechococcaceae TaxID=1890426 RepID=UPI0008FF513A|nr:MULTISPECIES: DUF4278 domain-containing protein [Synechococcaceae]MCT4363621.1 DUF4278 domain-containing protein [Candidatus Regnicoccus frigidus MAG-AL1]APD48567.1 hypothetical protein BM449_10430 [Synechococcus sp. SynAce01]MCT0205378.1 DUF4278 domain-containing protein [Synechococcus sp. CS-602]MCT0246872.1 DUF4278 domain-containing protein [Synechococcus sp. CS-601]MCT4367310.1 DUF4278 domain-containing protein [Candidatus Regnicoccus frigidus MAG-AL2]
MTPSTRVYRGVAYPADHQLAPSPQAVEHVYRGVHFAESLRHDPAPANESVVLHYRGSVYHQRRQDLAPQLQSR